MQTKKKLWREGKLVYIIQFLYYSIVNSCRWNYNWCMKFTYQSAMQKITFESLFLYCFTKIVFLFLFKLLCWRKKSSRNEEVNGIERWKLNIHLNSWNLLRGVRITSLPSAFNFWWKSIQIPINLRAIRFSAWNKTKAWMKKFDLLPFFSVGNISCERDSKDSYKENYFLFSYNFRLFYFCSWNMKACSYDFVMNLAALFCSAF